MSTRVTVILLCERADSSLVRAVKSLTVQTFSEFELFVLSEYDAAALRDKLGKDSLQDPRITFMDVSLLGWTKGLYSAIRQSEGGALLFCNEDDEFLYDTLERLYISLKNNKADVCIGFFADVYAGRENLVDWDLSQCSEVDRFEEGVVRFGPVPNRLYAKRVVLERLEEDGGFPYALSRLNAECVFAAQAIVGSDCFSCRRYRYPAFFEELPSQDDMARAFRDLRESGDTLLQKAISAIEEQKSAYEEKGDTSEIAKMEAIIRLYPETLRSMQVNELISEFFRHAWLLDEATLKEVVNEIELCLKGMFQKHTTELVEDNLDIDFTFPSNGEKYAYEPLVSFLIDPATKADEARRFLRSFFTQKFFRFEVIVPEGLADEITSFTRFPNVRIIPKDADGTCGWQYMAKHAKGFYAAMVSDDVFWVDDALYKAWVVARDTKVDFAAVPLGSYENISAMGLRSSLLVFDDYHRTWMKNTIFNQLDNSVNNKLVKRSTMVKNKLFSSNTSVARAMYEELTFSKAPDTSLLSLLVDSDYAARASAFVRVFYKPAYFLFRATGDILWAKLHNVRLTIEERALAWLRNKRPIKNQVLFYSSRGTGELTSNLKKVYDQLEGNKKVFTRSRPYPVQYGKRLRKELRRSRVIVTDDYINEIVARPEFKFSDKQRIVQLWHACGAFKKFGLDCFGVPRSIEHRLHDQYNAVLVSSESIRDIYAGAFGISRDTVLALGTPRTDSLLDPAENEMVAKGVLDRHPEFAGKEVFLYCPTFRQKLAKQVVWDTEIDWDALSEWLGKDKVFIVKKHPVDKTVVAPQGYANIVCADDENTNDLLRVTDVLITDYSSVIFDAALLNIPLVFYCPDIDTFERDFYLDFPQDLPGPVCEKSDQLAVELQAALDGSLGMEYRDFKQKYLSACDGKASERIADYIRDFLRG